VTDLARQAPITKGDLGGQPRSAQRCQLKKDAFAIDGAGAGKGALQDMLREQGEKKVRTSKMPGGRWLSTDSSRFQGGKLGVELSLDSNALRNQNRLTSTAVKQVAGRSWPGVRGRLIDEDFEAKTPTVVVKAQSDAYFRLLEREPRLREVFKLGNAIVWIAPSGSALVIDPNNGKEALGDAEIVELFKPKK